MEEKLDKILSLLQKLDEKVEDLLERVKSLESSGTLSTGRKSPSDIVMEQKLGEKTTDAGGRIKCPKCGSTQYNVVEDKTKPISYSGGLTIYAKKYQCRQCGYEWK